MINRLGMGAALAALFAFSWSQCAVAENSKNFGHFTVHYNAFSSDTLSPEIASRYGFTRSKNRGLLNITVLKNRASASVEPITALVKASASNLTGQLKTLSMREVREREAIYYISQFRVADAETLNFIVDVRPEGDENWHRLAFDQQFFTR